MTNAFTAGNNGFKGFTKREQALVTTDTSFKRTAWNAPIVSPKGSALVEAQAVTAIRKSQIDALERRRRGSAK